MRVIEKDMGTRGRADGLEATCNRSDLLSCLEHLRSGKAQSLNDRNRRGEVEGVKVTA